MVLDVGGGVYASCAMMLVNSISVPFNLEEVLLSCHVTLKMAKGDTTLGTGVPPENLGGGVGRASENPDPISDQNM